MPSLMPSWRVLTRLAMLLVSSLPLVVVGLPTAHATDTTVHLTLAAGQSGSIGRVVSNTNVTPVPSCDAGLSVSFDADLNGTVTVAPSVGTGSYACSVDFQVSGQSTGLVEHVLVAVVPTLSINDVSVLEGSPMTDPLSPNVHPDISFTHKAEFTVTLSEPSASAVTVAVATADGTATSAFDYTAVNATLTFQPGQTIAGVVVTITPDVAIERDETFTVNLSAPSGAVIADGQGTGTIVNDDGL